MGQITVKTEVSYCTLDVPDKAYPMNNDHNGRVLPCVLLEELPQEALDALVGQWLKDVYERANKPNPYQKPDTSWDSHRNGYR